MSEDKDLYKALANQQAFTEAILELAVDAIVTIDARGIVHSFNSAAERMFGYSADEIIGKNVSMLMPSPHREAHAGYLQAYLETGVKKIIGLGREELARHKDGSTFPMDLAVSEIQHSGQRWFTGILRDVTERRQHDRDLRRERDFIAAVLDTTASLVVVLDPQARIVRFNRACEKLTGYAEKEVRGKVIWELFLAREELTGVRKVFKALLEGKEASHYENNWIIRDGRHRLISWSNTFMTDAEGKVEYVISTGIDVTEQRRAEQQSAQHEKLAAVGQLASGIAHEIGNPLASISAVTQTVLRKVEDSYVKEKLGLVGKHIDRISTTVRQMMDFARPPRIEWKLSDVNTLLEEAIEMVRYDKRAKRVDIQLDLEPELPHSFAMPDLLSQVFLNIALNGLDALEAVADDQPRILAISTRCEASVLSVTFEDSGAGIPADIVTRIMEPFFTTKDVGKGTGLGLAVSYRIVKEHGGDIQVEGRPGTGAQFVVQLPVLCQPPVTCPAG